MLLKSLIGTLNSTQVEALIQEEKLKRSGYVFSYAIDSYDLRNYAYPLGTNGERLKASSLSIEYISDEQIALYTLFNKPDIHLYVFDEHNEEIKILLDILKSAHLRGVKVFNSVDELIIQLKNEIGGNINLLSTKSELVVSNISLLLTIAVGLQQDGVDKLNKISNTKRLILKDINIIDDILENSAIEDEFSLGKNELIDILYNYFIENTNQKRSKGQFEHFHKDVFSINELNRRISFTRDSRVISKVYTINSKLYESDSKRILLYFSSDLKTQDLFYNKSLKNDQAYNVLYNSSILVDNKRVNYHRSSAQVFLRLLCANSDSERVIPNLELIKSVIQLREIKDNRLSNTELSFIPEEKKLEKFLASQIDKCRREFEGYATFLQIDKFHSLINSFNLKNESVEDKKVIISILISILEDKGNAKNVENWRYNVFNRINDLSQIHAFRSTIFLESIKKIDQAISYHLVATTIESLGIGKDFIFGQDHHLPTFFLEEEEEIQDPRYIQIVQHYDDPAYELSTYVYELARKLFSVSENTDELVLKRCLLLLMLSNSKYYGEDTSEYLEKFLLNINFKNSPHESNYYYLLVWILRRNSNYHVCLKYSNKAIDEFQNDPRFYHSIALCNYCQYEENEEFDIDFLIDADKNAYMAYELYKKCLLRTSETNKTKQYIKLNMYAIMNTLIYIKSLGFSKHNNKFPESAILDSREMLNELKRSDLNFSNKPEYLHTEALLELQEYLLKRNYSKLYFSQIAIEKALTLPKINSRLKSLCLKLRDEIIEELNKFSVN